MTIDQKREYHRQRQQGILILCPICQYTISSYKRKQHYKTKRHINNLKNYIIVKVNEKRVTDAKETAKLLDQLGERGFRIAVEMINLKGEKELYTYR